MENENKDLEREYLEIYEIPEERVTSLKLALIGMLGTIICGLVALVVWLVGIIF